MQSWTLCKWNHTVFSVGFRFISQHLSETYSGVVCLIHPVIYSIPLYEHNTLDRPTLLSWTFELFPVWIIISIIALKIFVNLQIFVYMEAYVGGELLGYRVCLCSALPDPVWKHSSSLYPHTQHTWIAIIHIFTNTWWCQVAQLL